MGGSLQGDSTAVCTKDETQDFFIRTLSWLAGPAMNKLAPGLDHASGGVSQVVSGWPALDLT